jgi:hypothetical protein
MRREGGAAGYSIEIIRSGEELERHEKELDELVFAALGANAYLTPSYLLPLIRQHGNGGTRIALVRHVATGALVGCAPLSICDPTRRLPLRALSTFVSPHSRKMEPSLHREHARPALSALWGWMTAPEQPWAVALFENLSEASPFWVLLQEELAAHEERHWVREAYERPVLRRRASFDDYLASLPASRRKGWRRHLRDLEGAGRVEFVLHRDRSLAPDLAARFMRIEESSWKGAAGTALSQSPRDRAFFEECVERFASTKSLRFIELRLDDRPIAMSTNFVCGEAFFAFKIGYDPAFAEYSPGILVELEGIRRFHEEPGLEVADSGSSAAAYVRAYFRDSVKHQWVWVPTGHFAGRALVRWMPHALSLRNAGRAAVAQLRAAASREE